MADPKQLDAFIDALAGRILERQNAARGRLGDNAMDTRTFGTSTSGAPVTVLAGPGGGVLIPPIAILDVDNKQTRGGDSRCGEGIRTIRIGVKNATNRGIANSNQTLQLTVETQMGRAVTSVLVDGMRGISFSVNADTAVKVHAQIICSQISAVTGARAQLIPGDDLAVTCSVSWGGDSLGAPIFAPPSRIALAQNVASIVLPIPANASQLSIFTDTSAAAVTATLVTGTGNILFTSDYGRTAATTTSPVFAVGGADGYTLTLTGVANAVCSPTWSLAL